MYFSFYEGYLSICASSPVSDSRALHGASGNERDAGQGVIPKGNRGQLLHTAHHQGQDKSLDAFHIRVCRDITSLSVKDEIPNPKSGMSMQT